MLAERVLSKALITLDQNSLHVVIVSHSRSNPWVTAMLDEVMKSVRLSSKG